MSIEFDDKGKIFTEVVPKVTIPAVVQTTEQLIRGYIHVRRDERLKDELDRDELFLAITDAKILGPNGETLHQTRFLAVRRTQIVWVFPSHDTEDFGEV